MIRRAAVTGATGFIGWHLSAMLRDRGWLVRAITRAESRGALPDGVERATSAFKEVELRRCFEDVDVVMHLAGVTRSSNPSSFHAVNVAATREVVAAVRTVGTRLVHVSTQGVAGPATPEAAATEEMGPNPITPYAASKLHGEHVVRDAGLKEWVIVRPSAVYGPRDRNFLPVFKLASHGLFPLPHHPTAAYTLIHVSDLVAGIVAAATSTAAVHETFFLGHPDYCTVSSILETLAKVFDRRYRPFGVPRPMLRAAAWAGTRAGRLGLAFPLDAARMKELIAPGFVCSIDKARRTLEFRPQISLVAGFTETAEWYRRQGWLDGFTRRRAV